MNSLFSVTEDFLSVLLDSCCRLGANMKLNVVENYRDVREPVRVSTVILRYGKWLMVDDFANFLRMIY